MNEINEHGICMKQICSVLLVFALSVYILHAQEGAGRTPAKELPPRETSEPAVSPRASISVESARQLLKQGKTAEAKAMFIKADSLGLLTPDDNLLLGTLHYQAREFTSAEQKASAALQSFLKDVRERPLEAAPYKNTGVCYLMMNDLAKAEIEFVKYINRTRDAERSDAIAALESLIQQGVNKPDAEYLLRKYFVAIAEKDNLPPSIVILSPEGTRGLRITKVQSYKIEVVGLASDNVGVSLVRLNGSPATLVPASPEEIAGSNLQGKIVKFSADVMLALGDNQVDIEALDVAGNAVKQVLTVNRSADQAAAKAETKLPTIWAVVVGISKYEDRNLELRFANKDAQSFYGFLKSPGGGAIPDKQIDLLLDRNATRADIIQAINSKLRMAYDEDEVIIYIACHGVPDEVSGELYFLGYDADSRNIPGTGISQSDIQKAIATARAKKIVMIADACHSGSLNLPPTIAARGNAAYLTNKLLKGLTEVRSGIAMMTASSANEFSREGENWDGHGVFTYHLVRGLKGPADRNNDGVITIRELHEYVYRAVADDTNGSQHPDLQGRFDNDWPLGVVK